MEEGYAVSEKCNRLVPVGFDGDEDPCKGILLERRPEEGEGCICSTSNNPPCSFCTKSRCYCPECSWDASDEY